MVCVIVGISFFYVLFLVLFGSIAVLLSVMSIPVHRLGLMRGGNGDEEIKGIR